MEKHALKFTLSGKTAFFKKPDANQYAYFTYLHIHKIALYGLLGAIIGLKGYTQQGENAYPEFYEKLKNIKVAIVPDKNKKGMYPTKIQTFNNSVGYACFEQGGNLVVREQWLENPKWDIYLLEEQGNEEYEKIKDYLMNHKAVYLPYLGKNDHPATISQVEEVTLIEKRNCVIDSIFPAEEVSITQDSEDELPYFFTERAPYKMNEKWNFYEYREMLYTNYGVASPETLENLYMAKEVSLYFY